MSYIPKATVQAAIGAIPLEAGVPGGELILAMAVHLGPDHRPARGHRHLPVGRKSPGKGRTQRLSLFHPEGQVETAPGGPAGPPKGSGAVWKVIRRWKSGSRTPPGPALPRRRSQPWPSGSGRSMTPAPGQRGKTLRHSYTPGDYTFDRYWEILEG